MFLGSESQGEFVFRSGSRSLTMIHGRQLRLIHWLFADLNRTDFQRLSSDLPPIRQTLLATVCLYEPESVEQVRDNN